MPEHTPAPTPSRAVYGFVMYLSFKIFFIIYLIWAIVPGKYFEMIGIDFLPQQYWAIAVPIFILTVLNVFAFIIYPSLGAIMTPNVDDLRTITDKVGSKRKKNGLKHSKDTLNATTQNLKCICKDEEKCWKEFYESERALNNKQRGIPPLKDLEMWQISEHLFLK